MYGLDLSADIQTSIKRTPRKYAAMRSSSDRFRTSYKASDTALLPYYDVGKFTSLQTSVKDSPRKMSSLRSKVPRFPAAKLRNTGASESLYNTDVMRFASMGTQIATSPRSFSALTLSCTSRRTSARRKLHSFTGLALKKPSSSRTRCESIQIRCIYRRLDRCTDTDLTGASIVITFAEFLSLAPYKWMKFPREV